MVKIDSQKAKMVFFDSLQYLCLEDMNEAKKYLKNPEEYDFKTILNWE